MADWILPAGLALVTGVGLGIAVERGGDPIGAPVAVVPVAVASNGEEAAGDVAEMFAADRAFCRDAAARGLDGWMAWLAPDAIRIYGTDVVRGLDAIRERDRLQFADPRTRLLWGPADGGVLMDGALGFTSGPYRLEREEGDGGVHVAARGRYLSLWRHGEEGWRVVLDTGLAIDANSIDARADDAHIAAASEE